MNEYSDCLTLARAELLQAERLISNDIRSYPTPISGCDAAFNGLLDDRERVHRALAALNTTVFVPTPRTPAPASGVESR
ncbi:hypothetical protein [Gymnodinialimonas sp.]